jgi:hypothetical protein
VPLINPKIDSSFVGGDNNAKYPSPPHPTTYVYIFIIIGGKDRLFLPWSGAQYVTLDNKIKCLSLAVFFSICRRWTSTHHLPSIHIFYIQMHGHHFVVGGHWLTRRTHKFGYQAPSRASEVNNMFRSAFFFWLADYYF